jgi:RNA polymerase sigma-70 factor (sigma-E family)
VTGLLSSDDESGSTPGRRLGRRRAQAARDTEFEAFVAASATRLRRTAYLMCRDWHLAEDLTQTALARMYASWPRIWQTTNLAAYSRRVLMNVVFDQRKRRSDSEIVLADLPERPGVGAAGTELHVVLLGALATLPVRDQAIVVLRHWEDQSVEAVAEILGVSVSVVKMQSARSLAKLRTVLGEDFVLS